MTTTNPVLQLTRGQVKYHIPINQTKLDKLTGLKLDDVVKDATVTERDQKPVVDLSLPHSQSLNGKTFTIAQLREVIVEAELKKDGQTLKIDDLFKESNVRDATVDAFAKEVYSGLVAQLKLAANAKADPNAPTTPPAGGATGTPPAGGATGTPPAGGTAPAGGGASAGGGAPAGGTTNPPSGGTPAEETSEAKAAREAAEAEAKKKAEEDEAAKKKKEEGKGSIWKSWELWTGLGGAIVAAIAVALGVKKEAAGSGIFAAIGAFALGLPIGAKWLSGKKDDAKTDPAAAPA